jgi:tetratricopeptide (TPR) repeat protein
MPTQACRCGSGLSAGHCCDYDATVRTAPEDIPGLIPLVERAVQAWRGGNRSAAKQLCLEVLERAPDRPGALRVLCEICQSDGRNTAAVALLQRLLALDPNDYWATNRLTLLLLARGNLQDAARLARSAVRINPKNPQSHNLMGMAMTETQRPAVGEYHYRRALELSGTRIPMLLANLATNLVNQGRLAEARVLYRESNEGAPGVRQTLLGWARLEEIDRDFAAANALLDEVERLASGGNPAAMLARAGILGREGRYDEAITLLETAASAKAAPLRPVELLERGRLLDRMGRYDDAWADFTAGKERAHELSGNSYPEAEMSAFARRLERFFTRDRLELLPRAGLRADIPQPIFILGFPRSGTTLLEQTLSASPAICAGDELTLIHDLVGIMPRLLDSPLNYPEALSELWMGDQREGLDNMRDYYLQKVRQMGVLRDGATWFTDKMPLNEMHLGLIALMFPQAPLLHVIRHPLDVMVSAMSNFFTHGRFCSTTLESAAKHLLLVSDLVEHYRQEMELRYMPVRYEDIVDNQEATIRRVFDFIGAAFDPAVLQFEQNNRYARTASYAQVAEKLYDRSRFRYRNYRAYLEPVVPMLQPFIARLGYVI